MHKLTIKLSDKSGYNYDLVNDKNGKVIHSWKRSEMLEKWIDGYIPGNGKNFVKYVDKNGSGKIKVAPNKFVIPFRENMMKLKELLKEEEFSVRKYEDLRKLNSRLDSYQGVLKAFLGKYPKQGKPSQKGNEKRVIEIILDIEKIVKQLKDTAND